MVAIFWAEVLPGSVVPAD